MTTKKLKDEIKCQLTTKLKKPSYSLSSYELIEFENDAKTILINITYALRVSKIKYIIIDIKEDTDTFLNGIVTIILDNYNSLVIENVIFNLYTINKE